MKITGIVIFKNEAQYFLKESLQSFARLCDEIIAVDTGSVDNSSEIAQNSSPKVKVVYHKQSSDKNKQYGDIKNWAVKNFATGDYVFSFDADEVLDDDYFQIRKQLEDRPDIECWSIKGRHYYWHLNKEDNQVAEHWWHCRLFKNNSIITYPAGKAHGLPSGFKTHAHLVGFFVHHYGYCKNVCADIWRYTMNWDALEIHTPEYLNEWLRMRLAGTFPVKEVSLDVHPQIIKDKFFMERWNK